MGADTRVENIGRKAGVKDDAFDLAYPRKCLAVMNYLGNICIRTPRANITGVHDIDLIR